MILDEAAQGGQIFGFVEFGSGAVLLAVRYPVVDDPRGDCQGQENGQGHEVLLVSIEKLFEGARALGDFTDRTWGIWAVWADCGHEE